MDELTREQIKQAVDEAQRALDSSWYDRIRELGDMALRTFDAEARIHELEAALREACDCMDRARRIIQDGYRYKGWTEDQISWGANWGMLDTTSLRQKLTATAPPDSEPNQCDGCRRGLRVQDGIHVDHKGVAMVCTADRYGSEPTEGAGDGVIHEAAPISPAAWEAAGSVTPLQRRDALEELDNLDEVAKLINKASLRLPARSCKKVRRALLTGVPQHPDDDAVDRFADAMKAKLKWEREERGRGGWDDPKKCSDSYLATLLVDHLRKGNPGTFEDVANFAMMLHQRGAIPTTLAEAANAETARTGV